MKQSPHSYIKGYLLIEAMVAIGVLTTGVFSIFALMSHSIKLTRVINDQYVGTYLAAEGVEITKNILDANFIADPINWNTAGFDANRCYEIDITTTNLAGASTVGCPDASERPLAFDGTLYRYGAGDVTFFTRTIHIEPIIDGGQIGVRVVSTVKWASGNLSVSLEDKFYGWH